MLLNNLLWVNLLLFFYSLCYFFFKEGFSVEVSTNYFIQKSANCKSHGDAILWLFIYFDLPSSGQFHIWTLSPAPVFGKSQQTVVAGCLLQYDIGVVLNVKLLLNKNFSLYCRYVSVVVTGVWKLSEFCFISKLEPTNNSNKKWARDKIYEVLKKWRFIEGK